MNEKKSMTRRTLRVLVPKPQTVAACVIVAGSGIVAEEATRPGRHLEVYFEGNKFGAVNLKTYPDRIKSAAGRLALRYPTVARGFFDPADFVVVGTFTFTTDWYETRLRLTDEATVAEWIAEKPAETAVS
jgi:hypothetical protein